MVWNSYPLTWDDAVDPTARTLLCDAQTSGGLLIAVPAHPVDALIQALRAASTPVTARIGVMTDGSPGSIDVTA